MAQHRHTTSFYEQACHVIFSLLPPFVRNNLNDEIRSSPIHTTTYLDGFRGVMSFLVFVRHFLLPWYPNLDHGYGQGSGNDSILQLPVLRILYSGPNVPVFLVVSGYVMSLKPIKLARQGRWDAIRTSLASGAFRRAMRIFPPPIISTFGVMVMAQSGLFDYPYATLPGHVPTHPHQMTSPMRQFVSWTGFIYNDLTNPWTWSTRLELMYGAHLWTISLQFRCSMVLFLVLLALTGLRRIPRTILLLFITIFSLSHGRWDVALYLSGMGLAEMDVTLRERQSTLSPLAFAQISTSTSTKTYLRNVALSLALLAGLYFSSFPRFRGTSAATGYQGIYQLSTDYHYWHAYGAVLLIFCLGHSEPAQWFFTTSFTRYLGKLSFSLYLVHEPLLQVFGFRVVEIVWRLTGNQNEFNYTLGLAVSFIITAPILLWTADIFSRWVDEPCGDIARSIEQKFLSKR